MARVFTKADGSIDFPKTVAGLVVGLVLVGVAVFLWMTPDQGANGNSVWDFAKLVIVGVLGITLGEKTASGGSGGG